jgi:hypothetical protein
MTVDNSQIFLQSPTYTANTIKPVTQNMSKTLNSGTTLLGTERRKSITPARTDAVRAALDLKTSPIGKLAEHSLDITNLSGEDRAHLLSGPTISVLDEYNNVIRKDVPLRAFAASSTKLHDLLQAGREVTKFGVRGKVDHKSIERLLDIFTTNQGIERNTIELKSENFVQDILMYQACNALGIYYIHVKPLLNALRAEVSARSLKIEEMSTIANRVHANDPLLIHLANTLCYRRINKQIPDVEAFEKWLGHASRKHLQVRMVEIDQAHKMRRTEKKPWDGSTVRQKKGTYGKK